MHQYQLERGTSAYVVQFVIYPKDVNVADQQRVLQSSLDRTAKDMDGGKWGSANFVKLPGATGVDAIGLREGSEIRSYSVLKGRQLYTLLHIGAPGSARSAEADRFVASLKIGP